MKFNNDLTISIKYNTVIQLASKLLDTSCIVDGYDEDVNNESISSGVNWFTKL